MVHGRILKALSGRLDRRSSPATEVACGGLSGSSCPSAPGETALHICAAKGFRLYPLSDSGDYTGRWAGGFPATGERGEGSCDETSS